MEEPHTPSIMLNAPNLNELFALDTNFEMSCNDKIACLIASSRAKSLYKNTAAPKVNTIRTIAKTK